MMGPRKGAVPAALSTPTTHPKPRSIDSYTSRTVCKRGWCLVYFISRYRLPAHLAPAWGCPLIYFDKFFSPPSFPTAPFPSSAQTSTTSPLKRKAPTELEMHSKPYMIKVRSSFLSWPAAHRDRHGWLEGRQISSSRRFVRHKPTDLKGLWRPFCVQKSERQAVSWNIDLYTDA